MLVQLRARFVNAGDGGAAELELRAGLERDRVLLTQQCDHRPVRGFPDFTPTAFDEVGENAGDAARAVVFERRPSLAIDREFLGFRTDSEGGARLFRVVEELEQIIARPERAKVVG